MNQSKFSGILNEARNRPPVSPEESPAPKSVKKTGRRSDPDYLQANSYIPRSLHRKVKIQLLQDDREFSELIEELLTTWINERTQGEK